MSKQGGGAGGDLAYGSFGTSGGVSGRLGNRVSAVMAGTVEACSMQVLSGMAGTVEVCQIEFWQSWRGQRISCGFGVRREFWGSVPRNVRGMWRANVRRNG